MALHVCHHADYQHLPASIKYPSMGTLNHGKHSNIDHYRSRLDLPNTACMAAYVVVFYCRWLCNYFCFWLRGYLRDLLRDFRYSKKVINLWQTKTNY
jgi:hypothetical protein